jgi:hypothetical protein
MPRDQPPIDFTPLLRDLTAAVTQIRVALRPALRAVLPPNADFTSRQIAEAIGLDKTLGWRCLRIATIADEAAILGSLPREKGWKKILDGLQAAGCPEHLHRDLREAIAGVTRQLSDTGLSRDTLAVIAAGELHDQGQHESMRHLRRQHFEAGRLIWGISSRIELSAQLVAPAADGVNCDLAGVMLIDGITRHRDGPPWNVYAGLRPGVVEPGQVLDHASSPLLEASSRVDLEAGEVSIGATGDGRWRYDLVGLRGDRDSQGLRMAFCETITAVGPLHASEGDELVTMASPFGVPKEFAVVDLLVHESIHPSSMPYAALYATLDRQARTRTSWPETTRLPLEVRTEAIDILALPDGFRDLEETWTEVLEAGAKSLGRSLDEFRIHRTCIAHPPIPSTLVVRWGLPVAG